MKKQRLIEGLSLKVSALGEADRLVTLLTDKEGIIRLAAPRAKNPRSSLSAAIPLTFLKLQIIEKKGLSKIRQLKVIHSYSLIGKNLEALSAAQALSELCMMLVAVNDPLPGALNTVLMHLTRLESLDKNNAKTSSLVLANIVQAFIHLLALGGYGIPMQNCFKSGLPLDPPIGKWDWRCSLIPEEGFAIGSFANASIELNPSELALLQRLIRPNLPLRNNGELMGPIEVWLKLLSVIEFWIDCHLSRRVNALNILKTTFLK